MIGSLASPQVLRDTRTWKMAATGAVTLGLLGLAVGRTKRFTKAAIAGLVGALVCVFCRDRVSDLLEQHLPQFIDFLQDLGGPKSRPAAVASVLRSDPESQMADARAHWMGICDAPRFDAQDAMDAAREDLAPEVFQCLPYVEADHFTKNLGMTEPPDIALARGGLSREGYQALNVREALAFKARNKGLLPDELVARARDEGLRDAVIAELESSAKA